MSLITAPSPVVAAVRAALDDRRGSFRQVVEAMADVDDYDVRRAQWVEVLRLTAALVRCLDRHHKDHGEVHLRWHLLDIERGVDDEDGDDE